MAKLMEDRRGLRALLEDRANVLPDFGAVWTGFCLVVRCVGRETFPRVAPLLGLVVSSEANGLLWRCAERRCCDDCDVRFQMLRSPFGARVTPPSRDRQQRHLRGSTGAIEGGAEAHRWGSTVESHWACNRPREGAVWRPVSEQLLRENRRIGSDGRRAAQGRHVKGRRTVPFVCIEPRLERLQEARKGQCARTAQRIGEQMRISVHRVCSGSTRSNARISATTRNALRLRSQR